MKRTRLSALLLACAAIVALHPAAQETKPSEPRDAREKHLRNVRQLTFGGTNAEAYFSADDKQIIFMSNQGGLKCDQIFIMNADGSNQHMVSTGKGRTTCGYFFPDGKKILYSSTHLVSPECPAPPDFSKGYVWALYPGYDIFTAKPDGSDLKRLTDTPGYDAEAVVSRDGKKITFTSVRDGDLDVYIMDADGKNVKRLTNEVGYDGGPFFSYDGKWITYRASHPKTEAEKKDYEDLLKDGMLRPLGLDIWVMRSDGSAKRQVTHDTAANFAPFFFPSGKRIIFASNRDDPKGRNFDLYAINVDGTGEERVTWTGTFNSFPMFSSDGKKLVWASSRGAKERGEINIFIADWVE
jgi:Tol biopolymer transport system component